MELRHLRYFVALAEELHFARAAERLNIAPPTLTVQIQEIERTLSARLFVRTKRSVALTPAGEIFLSEARNVLEQFAKAESVGRRAGRGEIGRVEIGYVGSAAFAGVLQDQISRFSRAWPGVHLNAREFPMEELPQLIGEGQVDIGFRVRCAFMPCCGTISAWRSRPVIRRRSGRMPYARVNSRKRRSLRLNRKLAPTRSRGGAGSRHASSRRQAACSPY
jgi:DNA-binding transcriptional LysR family regulator